MEKTKRIGKDLLGLDVTGYKKGPGIISKGKINTLLGPGVMDMDLGPGIIS